MPDITLHSRDGCRSRHAAKARPGHRGASFTGIDAGANEAPRSEMIARSGRRAVPQVIVDGCRGGGFHDPAALHDAGGPDPRLTPGGPERGPHREPASHHRVLVPGSGPAGGLSGKATGTRVPGAFAGGGGVADPVRRKAVTAASAGAMTALDPERFLRGLAAQGSGAALQAGA